MQSNKPSIKSNIKSISSRNFGMFQLCSCNTDNIVYCSHGKCIHLPLHTLYTCTVLVDPQVRKSSLCLASLLHHYRLLVVCSRTQVDQLPNFLQMENVTKHTIADIHVLCVAKYLMMSEEIFQDPIS